MNDVRVIQGDCVEQTRLLESESVHCCVTSPPYWGLRDYGVAGQIGLEKTPQEYVARMVEVFAEVRRVLRDDGTCWVNLGDSYCGGNTGNQSNVGQQYGNGNESYGHVFRRDGKFATSIGLKPKDLCGIPWRVAFALQADGWYLRSDIIWHKPNPMPESVTDRPTKSHEYIFLLSKSDRYFYDAEAIKEKSIADHAPGNRVPCKGQEAYELGDEKHRTYAGLLRHAEKQRTNGKWAKEDLQSSGFRIVERVAEARANGADHDSPFGETRNKRSVWTVPTAPYSEAHFATFPPNLIKPCILAGCPVGGTVLDPFGGSGTTGMVALELGRNAVLIDLNQDYVRMIHERCNVTAGLGL